MKVNQGDFSDNRTCRDGQQTLEADDDDIEIERRRQNGRRQIEREPLLETNGIFPRRQITPYDDGKTTARRQQDPEQTDDSEELKSSPFGLGLNENANDVVLVVRASDQTNFGSYEESQLRIVECSGRPEVDQAAEVPGSNTMNYNKDRTSLGLSSNPAMKVNILEFMGVSNGPSDGADPYHLEDDGNLVDANVRLEQRLKSHQINYEETSKTTDDVVTNSAPSYERQISGDDVPEDDGQIKAEVDVKTSVRCPHIGSDVEELSDPVIDDDSDDEVSGSYDVSTYVDDSYDLCHDDGKVETDDEAVVETDDEAKVETEIGLNDVNESLLEKTENGVIEEVPTKLMEGGRDVVVEQDVKKVTSKKDDITLKDLDISVKDIQLERRRIIDNQAVRRKTIQNWINGQEGYAVEPEVNDPQVVEEVQESHPTENRDLKEEDLIGEEAKEQIRDDLLTSKGQLDDSVVHNGINSDEEEPKIGTVKEEQTEIGTVDEESAEEQPKIGTVKEEQPEIGTVAEESAEEEPKINTVKEEEPEIGTVDVESAEMVEATIPQLPESTSNGEIDSDSILKKKSSTKSYWESKMAASPPPIAVVDHAPDSEANRSDCPQSDATTEQIVCEFQEFDLEEPRANRENTIRVQATVIKPARVNGDAKKVVAAPKPARPIFVEVNRSAFSGNIVEQEIQQQKLREEEFRRETEMRSPIPVAKPQVIGEVLLRSASPDNLDEEMVLAPPTHYRDSSDSGTFDTESIVSVNRIKNTVDDDGGSLSPDGIMKKPFDPEISSDLGDEINCTSPSINHTGSYESLTSIGTSGDGSSVDFSLRRKERLIVVKPLSSEDELDAAPSTYQFLNETAVEKEIRQTKEREEALRLEKRIRSASEPKRIVDDKVIPEYKRNGDVKPTYKPSFATSRIQMEIEAQTNREMELKASGHIRTTSREHTDGKVTRIQSNISENGHKTINSTLSGLNNTTNNNNNNLNNNQSARRKNSLPILNVANNKGLSMQKFISSGGKVGGGLLGPFNQIKIQEKSSMMSSSSSYEPTAVIPNNSNPEHKPKIVRKSYCSAESKIQQELKQMKEREDELRRQRIRLVVGRSQPNLSKLELTNGSDDTSAMMDDDDDDEQTNSPSTLGFATLKERCVSNPNLLDDDDNSKQNQLRSSAPRRRSILIDQWENRIQVDGEK